MMRVWVLWAGLLLGGILIGIVVPEAADQFLGAPVGDIVVSLVPGLVGTLAWVSSGASAVAAFSWTVPLVFLMGFAVFWLDGWWSLAVQGVCVAIVVVMMFVPGAGRSWIRLLSRSVRH